MSEYIVSARKYRPDSFEELIGQDTIAKTLKNSILRGKLAHAYLFCGPRGVGKTSTARIFAKTINCAHPNEQMEPCGACESCISFQEGRSYCIHELDAASNNGVEDIKALMDQVQIPPQVGKYSVYIIDEVHMLSTQAFNAFLKTLEEPPAHAIFILATTEKHKILPTILSRCQTYDFNRISISDIVRNLRSIATRENITIDDESLHVIAQKADGAMRDALTIFDQTVAFCGTDVKVADVMKNLNVLDYEYSFSLVDAFLSKDYATALLKFDEVLSKGFNALHFVAALSAHLRDLAVSKAAGAASLLELPESLRLRYQEQAGRCSLQFLYDALSITTACETGYKAAVNPRLHIEFALMRLAFLGGVPASAAASAPAPGAEGSSSQKIRENAHQTPSAPVAAPAAPASAAPAPAAEPEENRRAYPQVHSDEVSSGTAAKSEEPKAEESPKPRRRAAKTGAALSLDALMQDQQTQSARPEEIEKAPTELPSDEVLTAKWQELAGQYSDKPRLASTLSNATLEMAEEDGRKVATALVMNVSQKQWIEERLLHELEGRFQKLCGSPRVALRIGVVPDTEKKEVLYTNAEKAQYLMSQNGDVKNLITDLGLDIK
ncbi:MAG: DNA polymerase III subunit gamma/tau [Bacteroidales bacterium]|nr:DNA polymerase III subunit gamma/tau [Bacteroidales bacterium]